MHIWIILPAFNEEVSIPLMFPKIKKVFNDIGLEYSILVINDGSSDNTENVLQSHQNYPLHIIRHTINRGLGETERDAFEYIASHASKDDIAIRLDCDDTHEPKYIVSLLEKMKQGYNVVNTSRFQPGGGQKGVSHYRALLSYSANIFMKLLFNIKGVRDYSCGYRAYKVKVLQDAIKIFGNGFIQLKGLGFTATLETIVKLNILGCKFAEVPFLLRYDKKASPSKMVSSITSLGYLTMALLYHWPWGGWMRTYKGLSQLYQKSREEAVTKFEKKNLKPGAVSQIGG